MTVARTDNPEIRQRMLAGAWGVDRAALVAKLAAAGIPTDQLLATADSFSLGQLFGLLEKTRKLDADSETFDYDWRYLVCQPSLVPSPGGPERRSAPRRCADRHLSRLAHRNPG